MRVALFGGSFDPIHRAHVALARAAAEAFSLDRVVFAPTGRQPLKTEPASASFADRLRMVELALEAPGVAPGGSEFVLSGIDAPRPDGGANYTVDVLTALAAKFPGAELWAIAGADSFLTLREWRCPERLLALAEWIVVSRPGSPAGEEELRALGLGAAERARVHLLGTVHDEVSATELRRRLREGEPCDELVPAAVLRYIDRHGLYR